MKGSGGIIPGAWSLLLWVSAMAQSSDPALKQRVLPVPVPSLGPSLPVAAKTPATPPEQDVRDQRDGIRFHLPAGWNLARRDGELSSFHLDARSASPKAQVRAVASLAFNPYPHSTFAGALFYLSVAPGLSTDDCEAQTKRAPEHAMSATFIGDQSFARGTEEHGKICTEARDITYVGVRKGKCVRFDLVVNNFCGGDVSAARDLTQTEFGSVYGMLDGVLQTVRFSAATANTP